MKCHARAFAYDQLILMATVDIIAVQIQTSAEKVRLSPARYADLYIGRRYVCACRHVDQADIDSASYARSIAVVDVPFACHVSHDGETGRIAVDQQIGAAVKFLILRLLYDRQRNNLEKRYDNAFCFHITYSLIVYTFNYQIIT